MKPVFRVVVNPVLRRWRGDVGRLWRWLVRGGVGEGAEGVQRLERSPVPQGVDLGISR